jgi:DNA-binding transcriptional ArsR family regulator
MPEEKDKQPSAIISRNDTNQGFLSGSPLGFVFKKIEKLSSAVYLVTNSWNDKEPLKWSLRDKSLCLLNELLSRVGEYPHSHKTALTLLLSRLAEIVSEIELAETAGLVSEMNSAILKSEYNNLQTFLKTNNMSSVLLSKDFFEAGDTPAFRVKELPPDLNAPGGTPNSIGHKGQIKDRGMSFRVKSTPKESSIGKIQPNGERRALILKVIKNKGEISVRDVAIVVKGVSEKTLQRELIAMSDEGILKKNGERRWSRYSMAK